MELIIGGAAQGKLRYAMQKYGVDMSQISFSLSEKAKIVNQLHLIIRRLLQNQIDPCSIIIEYYTKNPDVIFICDEVGSGLVPIDQFERAYRDVVGEVCCELAKHAKKVHRIYCGIGTVIKDV